MFALVHRLADVSRDGHPMLFRDLTLSPGRRPPFDRQAGYALALRVLPYRGAAAACRACGWNSGVNARSQRGRPSSTAC